MHAIRKVVVIGVIFILCSIPFNSLGFTKKNVSYNVEDGEHYRSVKSLFEEIHAKKTNSLEETLSILKKYDLPTPNISTLKCKQEMLEQAQKLNLNYLMPSSNMDLIFNALCFTHIQHACCYHYTVPVGFSFLTAPLALNYCRPFPFSQN